MKQRSCIVLRPVSFFLFLIVVVLSLAALLIALWFNTVSRIEKEAKLIARDIDREFVYGVRNASALFFPNINVSSINLARIVNSSLDGNNDLHFSKIESKVVPLMFQACSTLPYLTQISYIGLNGLFFAYNKEGEGDDLYALYSNSTFPPRNDTEKNYTWYLQPANQETGQLYDTAIKFPPSSVVEASRFLEASNSTNVYASIGTGWKNPQDVLLISSVGLNQIGVVSLGFSVKPLIEFLGSKMAIYGGSLYLITKDRNVVVRGLPNVTAIFDGDQVSFLLSDEGELQMVGNVSCQDSRNDVVLSIAGKKYVITCSPTKIGGLQFVFVFARPRDEHRSIIHRNARLSFALLLIMAGATSVILFVFVSLIVEAARREMFLCNALIKQMESTQQSERKSMNKSLAFASASHDIRASLAGISGLIELCRNEVSKRDPTRSEVVENLLQMEACTRDLLGILNCILDTSKIEAGKMQLEQEDFNVEQLLEDVVDLYHPAGMKKGVDVILDPCDGSISSWYQARGDRSKLKQILGNLLNNAIKFTNEGNVTVRAWARKPSLKSEVLRSNRSSSISRLLCLLFKIQRGNQDSANDQRDSNCMEFIFEVNDTGKGIPKEKRKSVFENYVQVKETMLEQEGTGLGLGIVQSLVRLMGGEIGIIEKEVGERGTCFRFNVMLAINAEFFDHLSRVENPSSQVILMINSSKRSSVVQAFMEKLGIKVQTVKHQQQLAQTLKQMKRKLLNQSSSCNSTSDGYASSSRSVPLSTLDGVDDRRKASPLVLIVVDTRVAEIADISCAIADLRRDLNPNCYSRVVWLDSSNNTFDEDKLPPPDLVISKPFHGSRLYETIALLPEFGGVPPRRGEISARSDSPPNNHNHVENHRDREIEEQRKPLIGKRILIVDDDPIGQKIATFVASQLGAISVCCENGAAAWQLVCRSLEGESSRFDCILMDCEMPAMDGREATARIREAESGYGVRTPIVALTAHGKGREIDNMIQAGVDGYIAKPLNKDNFLKLVFQFIS